MMSSELSPRQKMNKALKLCLDKTLKQHGFKANFPHYRRFVESNGLPCIEVISVLFHKHGYRFVFDHGIDEIKQYNDVSLQKITVWHMMDMSKRNRINSDICSKNTSGWFEFYHEDTDIEYIKTAEDAKRKIILFLNKDKIQNSSDIFSYTSIMKKVKRYLLSSW